MSENRVLSKMSGPRREEVTGDWGILHNGRLYNLRCSPYIIRIVKSRKVVVTSGTFGGGGYGKLQEIDHLEDLGIDGRVKLKCTLMLKEDIDWIHWASGLR